MNEIYKPKLEELKQLVRTSHIEIKDLFAQISNKQFLVFDAVEELEGELEIAGGDQFIIDELEDLRRSLRDDNGCLTDAIEWYYESEKRILELSIGKEE